MFRVGHGAASYSYRLRNYYGSMYAKESEGKFFLGIENYDDPDGPSNWEEIPKSLYLELKSHQETITKKIKDEQELYDATPEGKQILLFTKARKLRESQKDYFTKVKEREMILKYG